jgi:predicted nucleotidyltransferase
MTPPRLNVPQAEIAEWCRRNGVIKLSLFGSILTGAFTPTSDIDVLVEFEPGRPVGLLQMAAMERELSVHFEGRKIDLRTPGELSRYFRQQVMDTAAVQYAAG